MSIVPQMVKYAAGLITYVWWKGVLERFMALCLLLILSPVMAVIAIAIRLDSPGNPIFTQKRLGKNGHSFTFYKFRTMHRVHDDTKFQEYWKKYIKENSSSLFDEKGEDVYQLINDPRITRLGAI